MQRNAKEQTIDEGMQKAMSSLPLQTDRMMETYNKTGVNSIKYILSHGEH